MNDFFEIDFLDVDSNKSGDAITLRYKVNGKTHIHVVDGGFQDTGDKVIEHINKYFDKVQTIDRVIVTHSDGDHAGGLRKVLEEFKVRELWMLRPWIYAGELIDRFTRFSSVANLSKRLKEIYPNLTALEEIASQKGIVIYEPFQGNRIGEFTVMAPTKSRYLDVIVESEKTPEAESGKEKLLGKSISDILEKGAAKVMKLIRAAWGEEIFSDEETNAENEMSVIQYANICGKRILLTGDAGRAGLKEAADYAPFAGLLLPGIDRFQVSHHGSRRNVSTEILDKWLGKRLQSKPEKGQEKFTTIISASKKDEDHPRKAVVRALIHRGAKVVTTEGASLNTSHNAPERSGWVAATPLEYPETQEE